MREGVSIRIPLFSNAVFKSSVPLFVGAINENGTPTHFYNGDVYYFRVYDEEGQLARNYAPCTRNSDGKEGLFDLIYQRFYPVLSVVGGE